jgi:hypothetical protein
MKLGGKPYAATLQSTNKEQGTQSEAKKTIIAKEAGHLSIS